MRIFSIVFLLFFSQTFAEAQDNYPYLTAIRPPFLILNDGLDSLRLKGLESASVQTIFMVFHAEQDEIGLDPGLSTDGRWRAIQLMNLLKNVEFEKYFSTPFRKNVLTLEPLTNSRKAEVSLYDQADLKSLFKQLDLSIPDELVMVVQIQTFPQILRYLLGTEHTEILSSQPTDMIYILERKAGQQALLHKFKYKIR
ncbi:MAG: hypothetical protein IPM48_08345 [Saprospiraceae bacterium]|nr:hypothetical protein [Saprospiraceae bacterium]